MSAELRSAYIELLKKCVSDTVHSATLSFYPKGLTLNALDAEHPRHVGMDWPGLGETMIGLKRLDNIQQCVEAILRENVPGDLIETGVWRGGATIFMRGILKAWEIRDRTVYVADSFQGLPPPNPQRYPQDAGSQFHQVPYLAVSLEQVRANFERYGLLDEQVKFVPGLFAQTLPTLRDRRWSLVRIDGDMYESTMDALTNLHANLSPGGYAIIDEYHQLESCRRAVDDYRSAHGIRDEIRTIDTQAVYWRKS